MTETPQVYRRQLGHELRAWRTRRGVSREAVVQVLACSLGKLSKIETGKALVSPLELRVLLDIYEVEEPERERINAIADEARKRAPFQVPQWMREFVGLEATATVIEEYEVQLVPGLLQTEAYTRAITQAADPTRNLAEVDRLVALRNARQRRLAGDSPPELRAVIHEAALTCMVGGPDVMRQQLVRLLELAGLPNVSIRVLPFSLGAHPAMSSPFAILTLPEDSRVVYLETLWRADYVDREQQVAAYSGVFDRLVGAALDEESTVMMIDRVVGEL